MAAARVGQQFIEQEPVVVVIPQMVMRIDDLQIGLEDFLLALGEPGGIWEVTRGGWRIGRPAGRRGVLGDGGARHQRRAAQ
jgi:hypothetical protein